VRSFNSRSEGWTDGELNGEMLVVEWVDCLETIIGVVGWCVGAFVGRSVGLRRWLR
jgi:hypothetical protein